MRLRSALALAAAALTCALTCAPAARAAERGFDARTWKASLDPRAGTSIEPATVPSQGRFLAGASAAIFKNPLTLGSGANQKVVSTQRLFDVGLGMIVARRLLVGVDLPFVVQESRPLAQPVAGVTRTAGTGIGDLGIQAKVTLVSNELGGFGLAALGRASLPTGDPATFVAERGVSAQGLLLVDYDLLLAGVQASVGFKGRSTPADLAPGVRYGNELPFHAAVWIRPSLFKLDPVERQRWEIGVHGSLPAGPAGPFGSGTPGSTLLSPVVLRVGDRILVGKQRDVTLTAGLEIGLGKAAIAPSYGLFLGVVFGPREHDRDHDGIDDTHDACPDVSDVGAQPSPGPGTVRDGCPVVSTAPVHDRDHDRIPDADDACPDEAGLPTDDLRCHGCAIGDRDHDGVDDHDDRCPEVRGVPPDGCPAEAPK